MVSAFLSGFARVLSANSNMIEACYLLQYCWQVRLHSPMFVSAMFMITAPKYHGSTQNGIQFQQKGHHVDLTSKHTLSHIKQTDLWKHRARTS